MTVLSAQTIRTRAIGCGLIAPFHEQAVIHGMTYGLGPSGYDIRIDQRVCLPEGDHRVVLASAMERLNLPSDLVAMVHDKSTWARRGLFLQNTVAEPGWHGYLTLELTWHGSGPLVIEEGTPIAQVIFHKLDAPTEQPYRGKYQNQPAVPVAAVPSGQLVSVGER